MRTTTKGAARGFTLLELIIVIAILAILSVAVILVINPAETLARARDSQRLSDLAAMKSAIGLYLAEDATSPDLNDAGACDGSITSVHRTLDANDVVCGDTDPDDARAGSGAVDGSGWLPVDLTGNGDGLAPALSNFPFDPVNTSPAATGADDIVSGTTATLMYTYTCGGAGGLDFELTTNLESVRYRTDNDIDANDGGDIADIYESGTDIGGTLCASW
jgi:prepilin-type N-terminal cleavage/methylation domain-containing protein